MIRIFIKRTGGAMVFRHLLWCVWLWVVYVAVVCGRYQVCRYIKIKDLWSVIVQTHVVL